MFLKILILVSLIKILMITEKPLLCAGIYAGAVAILGMASAGPSLMLLVYAVIAFGCATLYFWLLQKFKDTVWFWVIAVAGILVGWV